MNGKSVTLFEVIMHHDRNPANAYGLTFHCQAMAEQFAEEVKANGYKTDISPAFATEATLASALASAALFFKDERLEETR